MADDLVSRGVYPRKEFECCGECTARSMCKAARHCARTVSHPGVMLANVTSPLQPLSIEHVTLLAEKELGRGQREVLMSYETGEPLPELVRFVRAVEAAHGIKE